MATQSPKLLFAITAGAAAYVALTGLGLANLHPWLDAVSNAAGLYAIGVGILALGGLGLMLREVGRGGAARAGALRLLAVAIAWAAANVGAFVVTLSVDRFLIFEPLWVGAVVLAGPAVAMGAAIFAAIASRRVSLVDLAGFEAWIASAGIAQVWIVAAASASV